MSIENNYEVSFVVPAYNEAEYIEMCIESIIHVCSGEDIRSQIVVVDNGSTDGTSNLVRGKVDALCVIDKCYPATARNAGVKQTTSPVLVFVDADVELTQEWGKALKKDLGKLAKDSAMLTGIKCTIPTDSSWIEKNWFDNLASDYLGGANMITNQYTFAALGGFDESLETGEDFDLCLRAKSFEESCLILNCSYKAIHHGYPKNLRAFMRREIWHGTGDALSFRHILASKVAMVSAFHAILIFLFIISLLLGEFLIAVAFWAGVLAIVSFLTIKRFGWRWRAFWGNCFLNFIYLISRFLSIIKRIIR